MRTPASIYDNLIGRFTSRAPSAPDGEDLLSFPQLWRRVTIGLFVVVAACPMVAPPLIIGWVCCWCFVCQWEQAIARVRGYVAADLPGCLVSFSLAALQALAAAVLIHLGDGGSRFFAVALIGVSTLGILLRYYTAPRILLAAMAPNAALILWVCGNLAARYAASGEWLRALTPVVTVGAYAILIWPTRGKLMEAWLKLLGARAQAQEGWSAAEHASRAKSEFLATISHEIRTPLNGILGMAQSLEAGGATPEHRAQLRTIRGCGETLLSILDEVLDLSRIEAGTLKPVEQEFDMEHVTRSAAATFGPLAAKQGLTLDFSIDDAAKGAFVGDAVRIRQILYNLISNAVKFTQKGRVAVGVTYVAETLRIEVVDSGIGIPPDKIECIFEKFVQADASTTRRVGGAGLGLTICRELATLMGGAVRASSVEGRGSVFSLILPIRRLGDAYPLSEAPIEEARPIAAAPIRILAAEDNEVNRLVLSTLLGHDDVALTMVENGREAVAAWGAADWDVILMDIQMPEMDGVTAAREIRAAEAKAGRPQTPIIAVTANALPHQRQEYEAAGMGYLVSKPIDAATLLRVIHEAREIGVRPSLAA